MGRVYALSEACMLAILLSWTARDVLEVAITGVLITVVMAIMAAAPFIAEYYIDDRRAPPKQIV